ncbi:MAG: hypothetical protein FJ280_25180 [Planctomycetes bacterium]|nr:hypothetical protein [Planctomycetota bacterium]
MGKGGWSFHRHPASPRPIPVGMQGADVAIQAAGLNVWRPGKHDVAEDVLDRAAQAASKGPKNTGMTLPPPRTYETKQERRARSAHLEP